MLAVGGTHHLGLLLSFPFSHVMQVTIDQVIGGARGIKSMIWETSNLDADEVSFAACPVRGCKLFRYVRGMREGEGHTGWEQLFLALT